MERAADLFEDQSGLRIVGNTTIDAVRVSTIHLVVGHPCRGCDNEHGWCMDALFETMVFGGPLDQRQWRYHTQLEAVRGHEDVVKQVREAMTRQARG